jgi:hypothetical protein
MASGSFSVASADSSEFSSSSPPEYKDRELFSRYQKGLLRCLSLSASMASSPALTLLTLSFSSF